MYFGENEVFNVKPMICKLTALNDLQCICFTKETLIKSLTRDEIIEWLQNKVMVKFKGEKEVLQ